jgi:endonuclease/exonuclease/phosphatase family metal-dependent hydrolase
VRAAQLLQQTLNSRLDPSLHYTSVLMKEVSAGRHIAPVLITRLPTVRDRTRLLGSRQRTLQSTVVVDGKELNVIVSHWTSRLKETNQKNRADYADKIYGACNAMYHANPGVDFLVCGDWNDTPADDSVVNHLHATGNAQVVLAGAPLRLFHLQATKDPNVYGTHYYQRWFIFDQIAVSPGMLDAQGWSCDPDSVQTMRSLTKPGDRTGRPWRFGGEKETGQRGYSDHFPVTVRLKVNSSAGAAMP